MLKITRIFSLLIAAITLTGLASATVLELCPAGAFVGSPAFDVTITTSAAAQCKSKTYDDPLPGGTVHGLGVAGATGGEIDNGESVTLDFTGTVNGSVDIASFDIIVFYNGPEFGDREEEGYVEVTYVDNSIVTFTFTAVLNTVDQVGIIWNGHGTATNVSPMTQNNAGWFEFTDIPFGRDLLGNALGVKSLTFTAANLASPNNNSDYALRSVVFSEGAEEEVPEPSTYALMGLGLLAVGFLKRRSKA